MSNGWIAMPLNALAFALQLATHERPLEQDLRDEPPPPPDFLELAGLTDEINRQLNAPPIC